MTFASHGEESPPFFKRFNLSLQNFLLCELKTFTKQFRIAGYCYDDQGQKQLSKALIMAGFPVANYYLKAAPLLLIYIIVQEMIATHP